MGTKPFSNYMINKLHETHQKLNEDETTKKQPFITISREYGCNAHRLIKNLSEELSLYKTTNGKSVLWKAVDHEILASAAKEIGVDHAIIDQITYQNINDYLISFLNISFSKYNTPSTEIVKNTIEKIVLKFATAGHVILLGRGGVTITRNLPNALHIRLIAPLKWRAEQVMHREKISMEKAMKLISKIDKTRNEMRDYFGEKKNSNIIFDLIFNVMRVHENEIINIIKSFLLTRSYITK
jgi:cytidylate kinase